MITKNKLEQLCLEWFQSIGYKYVCGNDIAPDGVNPERADKRLIIFIEQLLCYLQTINSQIILAASIRAFRGPYGHNS